MAEDPDKYNYGPAEDTEAPESTDEQETKTEETPETDDKEYTPTELKAMEDGWRPFEEWDGDPDEWVDAKQFVFRGELMKRIQDQTKEIKRLRGTEKEVQKLQKALQELGKINQKIAEKEYERALHDLKQRKAEAYANEDFETVAELDDKISDAKKLKPEVQENIEEQISDEGNEEEQPQLPQEIQEWVSKNPWYKKDRRLTALADGIAAEFLENNPDASPAELVEYVDEELAKEAPSKFGKKKAARTPVVEPSADGKKSRQNTKKYTEKHLNADQKEIAKRFVETGALKSVQDYVDQLAELGELDTQRGV